MEQFKELWTGIRINISGVNDTVDDYFFDLNVQKMDHFELKKYNFRSKDMWGIGYSHKKYGIPYKKIIKMTPSTFIWCSIILH